ncbi:MAG: hypothetical protein ACVCEJ_03280 [Candidatus Izemoplasmataceae bacterium]
MLYVLIKHQNLIESDEVEVICVTDSIEKAYRQLLIEAEPLYEIYQVVENLESSKKFTDEQQEILIELSIHESMLVEW